MRIEADQFPEPWDGREMPKWGYRVTLDGREIMFAQMADDVAGEVAAPVIDAKGMPVFDLERDDFFIVTLKGEVKIEPLDDPPSYTEQDLRDQIERSPFNLRHHAGFVR